MERRPFTLNQFCSVGHLAVSGPRKDYCRTLLAFTTKKSPNWSLVSVVMYTVQVALFDISIWHIDCRYINTFEKYRYRYRYWYGEVENIDIDIDIDRAILKNIDIDKVIPKISISIWWLAILQNIDIKTKKKRFVTGTFKGCN